DFVVVTLAHARGPGTGDRGPVGITASCFILFRSIKTRGRGQVTRNRTSMVPGPRSPGPRLLLLLAVVLDLGELGVHDVLGGRSALAAGGFTALCSGRGRCEQRLAGLLERLGLG